MEKAPIIIISILSIMLLSLIISIFIISPDLSPTTKEECNSLYYSKDASINLVFFGSEEKTKEYADSLFSISPLNKNKGAFNVFYINKSVECELYKDIAVYCYSKELIKTASSCPSDYIFVLKEDKTNIRSSSYMNVLSINTNSPKVVIAHEFAHSFVNLAEEYTPASIPSKSKNCVQSCEEFNKLNDGCFLGCSQNDYYRSIDLGIMRTLYSTKFGQFNENLISEKIIKINEARGKNSNLITGNVIEYPIDCNNNFYYLLSGTYSNGELNINKREIESGCPENGGEGAFSYKILDKNNNVISDNSFNPELIFTDAQSTNEEQINGETYAFEGEFYLKVPNIQNAEKLEVYNKANKKVASISIDNLEGRPCKVE